MTCPSCGHVNPPAQHFCGQCGAAFGSPDAETRTSPAPPPRIVTPAPRPTSEGGRFLPGTMLGGRYRMIGLLGRGGMGEVYRADDTKLGQSVALKFLPRDVEGDPDRLERLLTEVRLSLRVTHPNVCRVFDIGEADGRYFISMEYVDGEDLASLLRRIGRLPEDKAIEIARQLCAGLSAAHEEGVLHRDLKPANVMLDGRGRAKITDFGLAGATAGIAGAEARAGTPQYMAPEQASGGALTERTDVYALGLVLYELFTGKRAFEIKDLDDLARRQNSAPTSPSAHITGLDPAVERAILRCLDPDPARRPASASALAAALPGGDPLAMALAAGETPSPEMVARAGGTGALSPAIAGAALAVLLAGLVGIWFIQGHYNLTSLVAMPKPPAELVVAARAALAGAGTTARPSGAIFGFQRDVDYFDKVNKEDQSPHRWDALPTMEPTPIWFWYRESPESLAPAKYVDVAGPDDPPLTLPGMTLIRLDPSGRLQQLQIIPADRANTSAASPEPDWMRLFGAAGLDLSTFAPVDPQWTPPVASDVRRAWTKADLRVEAAAFGGHPVWFALVPPWRKAREVSSAQQSAGARTAGYLGQAIALLIVLAAAFLARRNIRQGRSDRRGALRFGVAFVSLGVAADLLRMTGDPVDWIPSVTQHLALQVYVGIIVWLFYIALEPYVRRLWPNTLIAWSRALEGRFRDPLVGRHVLMGALAGLVFSAIFLLPTVLGPRLGLASPIPADALDTLAGVRQMAGTHVAILQNSFFVPVAILLAVLVLRVIFRRPWLAYAAIYVLMLIPQLPSRNSIPEAIVMTGIVGTLIILILTRLGLLAFLVAVIFSYWSRIPLTTDPGSWHFASSVVTMLLFAALAVFAFIVSLGGQALFKDPVLE